jgi:hypothetical protein
MPINNQSVGKDVSICLITSKGNLNIPAAAITKFDATTDTSHEARKGLDGVTRNAVFPNGWKGSLEIDRMDSTVDDFWAQYESDYYAGLNLLPGTINETISEANGSISQYRYEGVMFELKDAGSREADKVIKMKLDFYASRRKKA